MPKYYYKISVQDTLNIQTMLKNTQYCHGLVLPLKLTKEGLTLANHRPVLPFLDQCSKQIPRNLMLSLYQTNGKETIQWLLSLRKEIEQLKERDYHIMINDDYLDASSGYLNREVLLLLQELIPGIEIAVTNQAKYSVSRKWKADYLVDIHGDQKESLEELNHGRKIFLPEDKIESSILQEIITKDSDHIRNQRSKKMLEEGYSEEAILLSSAIVEGYHPDQLHIITSNPKTYHKKRNE